MERNPDQSIPRTRADIARENGAKSRGPVSPDGKAASSRNATRHGLLARTVVLPTESKKRFAKLLTRLRKEMSPRDEVERHLVDCMAVARWRQMRSWGFECSVMSHEIREQTAAAPDRNLESDTARAALTVRHSEGHSRFLDRVNYWEARFDRQYDRALKRLHEHRKFNSAQTNPQTPLKTSDQDPL